MIVLTGAKDGVMLLGEIEPGMRVKSDTKLVLGGEVQIGKGLHPSRQGFYNPKRGGITAKSSCRKFAKYLLFIMFIELTLPCVFQSFACCSYSRSKKSTIKITNYS